MRNDRTTLLSRLRKKLGQTPGAYIRTRRLRLSMDLLEAGERNISEIAIAVGIPEPTNFSRFFRNNVGISPSQYRNDNAPDGRGDSSN